MLLAENCMSLYINIQMKCIFMVFCDQGNVEKVVFLQIKKLHNNIYKHSKLEPNVLSYSNFLHLANKCIEKAPVHQNYLEYANHDRDM